MDSGDVGVYVQPTQLEQDELHQLARLLVGFRWRLGLERALLFGLRGLCLSSAALIGLSSIAWLSDRGLSQPGWLVAVPAVGSLILALIRWPSTTLAARVADRRLLLDERLGTAVELSARSPSTGRFDRLQIRDAVARARAAPFRWLAFGTGSGWEALLASMLVVLATASLLLPALPRPRFAMDVPNQEDGIPPELPAQTDLGFRAVPEALDPAPAAAGAPIQASRSDSDLAARVQQQLAERDAFDKLAQALGALSAAQPAADAIQRGDFSAARQQLTTLGEEADQLSGAAKQQLAQDLQRAAQDTMATDRQLADRERQAAAALARNAYTEQRQALRALGDQVERSGTRASSADQLARDIGRLQQQANGQQAGMPPASASNSAAAGAQQPAPVSSGGAGGDTNGPPGPGAGSGPGPDDAGDQATRLDSAGQSVQVPAALGAGPGVRPIDGTEEDLGTDPTVSGSSVSELAQAQRTGQVVPEQNLVPGERRPVVRGYFR